MSSSQKKKILITGTSGFVGKHLIHLIKQKSNLEFVLPTNDFDLLKPLSISHLINTTQFDFLIHLAAQSFVPRSFEDPKETFDINFYGTFYLLEALKKANFAGTFLYISSSDIYGMVEESNLPITEKLNPNPRSPYATSKAASELLCKQYSIQNSFKILVARPFNHIGPGQGDNFVIPAFIKKILEAKKNKIKAISVGNLEITRDFTDVRDVVESYLLLLEHGISGEIYNICSGNEYKIGNLLNEVIQLVDIDLNIEIDNRLVRLNEQKRVCGSYEKLKQCTGWSPKIDINQSIKDIYSEKSKEFFS